MTGKIINRRERIGSILSVIPARGLGKSGTGDFLAVQQLTSEMRLLVVPSDMEQGQQEYKAFRGAEYGGACLITPTIEGLDAPLVLLSLNEIGHKGKLIAMNAISRELVASIDPMEGASPQSMTLLDANVEKRQLRIVIGNGGSSRGVGKVQLHIIMCDADLKLVVFSKKWEASGALDPLHRGFGVTLTNIGDVDGDGYSDVLCGANADGQVVSSGAPRPGYVQALSGKGGERLWILEPEGQDVLSGFGRAVSTCSDQDGDGVADIALGYCGYFDNSGRVLIVSSRTGAKIEEMVLGEFSGTCLQVGLRPAGDAVCFVGGGISVGPKPDSMGVIAAYSIGGENSDLLWRLSGCALPRE